jgi:hypothetical protein
VDPYEDKQKPNQSNESDFFISIEGKTKGGAQLVQEIFRDELEHRIC